MSTSIIVQDERVFKRRIASEDKMKMVRSSTSSRAVPPRFSSRVLNGDGSVQGEPGIPTWLCTYGLINYLTVNGSNVQN